jgi:pyruvate ferredoxin oxidoreductase gamma subunit
MLRVRFHGRGGHGIKTAGHILGTAAFLSGFEVQDFPIYGAERRGAAVAAYVRIDRGPIRERGVIRDPDLILIADETLLDDPSAGVLAGVDGASAVFVNSTHRPEALAGRYAIACPVLAADLSELASEVIGRGGAVSALLGAAACALTGVVPAGPTAQAVREELTALRLPAEVVERNETAARRVHALLPAVSFRERPETLGASVMHEPAYDGTGTGTPTLFTSGNASARHTGSWRQFRPVIDRDVCTRCGLCFVHCPDGAISFDAEGYPVIDYDNCKGCMICRAECPVAGIVEEKEVRPW